MRIYDRYGIDEASIDEVAQILSNIFDIQWVPHNSLWFGDYYKYKKGDGEVLSLNENYNEYEDAYLIPEHSDQNLVLYINTDRTEEIEGLLMASELKITLLRRKTEDELSLKS